MYGASSLAKRDQALVQGQVGGHLVGVLLRLPEAAPGTAHVPVGELVHEVLDGPAGREGVILFQTLRHLARQDLQLGQDPAVHQRPLRHRHLMPARIEAVDVGVERVEGVGVPQGEGEAADDLVDGLGVEAPRVPGRAHREEVPAQGVRALHVQHAPGVHHVAHPLGHLAAFGVQDVAQADHVLV